MKAYVTGDENEIEIQIGEQNFSGDLFEASEDGDTPEVWEIDGLKLKSDPILCLSSLEALARRFLKKRKVAYDEIEVHSDSFDE